MHLLIEYVSFPTDSGVGTYTDLFYCWIRAMNRVKVSCGQAHIETIVSKLPLSPCDDAVLQQAYPHGWDTRNEFEHILCVLMFWFHITWLSEIIILGYELFCMLH